MSEEKNELIVKVTWGWIDGYKGICEPSISDIEEAIDGYCQKYISDKMRIKVEELRETP